VAEVNRRFDLGFVSDVRMFGSLCFISLFSV
jgi:hypothetical protein